MPLLRNTAQPYFPDPNSPNRYSCNGTYCWPVNLGDTIHQQFYQTPCGNNELTDPDFGDLTLGAELITNGTFTGSLASWTESPAGSFVYDAGGGGRAMFDYSVGGMNSNIEQTGLGIVAGSMYQLSMSVTGLTTGNYIEVFCGGTEAFCVITPESLVAGVFTTYSLAGSDNTNITIVAVSDADFYIDSVSLKLVTMTNWDFNGQWQAEDGYACKEQAGTGDLEETVANYLTAGGYYSLTFTVVGYTSGTLTPYLSATAGTAVSANGTYTQYITPAATGVVKFTPSSDFIGCITDLDLRALRNDYTLTLYNQDTGDDFDLSSYLEYYEDKVTLSYDMGENELDYGCYYMELLDSCLTEGNELVTNGTFAAGSSDWTLNNAASQYSFAAGEASFLFDPTDGSDLVTNGNFAAGATGWTVGAGWGIVTSATHTPGSTAALSQSITIAAAPIIVWVRITLSGCTAGSFTVTVGNKTSGSYQDNGTWWIKLLPTTGPGAVTFSINPTSAFDGTIDDIEIYDSTLIISDFPLMTNLANTDIVAGNYSLSYDITAISATGTVGVAGTLIGMSQSAVYNTTIATHTVSITNYVPGAQAVGMAAQFSATDSAGGKRYYEGSITIDNVSLVRVEPFEATYTSECLNFQLSHARTKMVTAYCDQEAFGFEFDNTGFRLQQRIWCRSIAPSYRKAMNTAEFGTGDSAVKYAEVTKSWQLHTDLMSETAHDCLAVQTSCDHFAIGDNQDVTTEYTVLDDDYTPNWNQSGSFDLATSVVELRLKSGGQIFNRHT